MIARTLASLNEESEYVFPSIPGKLKSGAFDPMARVSSVAKPDVK
jgi:hypothetical protein